jgi:hypothetical protein
MSRTSCIQHPARERLLVIHEWQLEFCTNEEGKVNECAAALLSFLEYWHNLKLDMVQRNRTLNDAAEREKKGRPYSESLLQWHTAEMEAGLLIFKRSSIQVAIDFLLKKKVIEVHRNPVLRYDNTRHFLFHPEMLNEWLLDHVLNSADASAECSIRPAENSRGSAENSRTIPETSSEITTKSTTATTAPDLFTNGHKPDHPVVVALSCVASEEDSPREISDKLTEEFGLSIPQGREVETHLASRGAGYVIEKAEIVRNKKAVKNMAGAFMKALSDDWKAPKSISAGKPVKKTQQAEPENQEPQLSFEERKERLAATKAAISTV